MPTSDDWSMGDYMPTGSAARFQVCADDGRRGSTWSIRTSAAADDVYVIHREGGRWAHASFHASGEWHFAISKEGQDLDPDGPAHLGVLRAHDETAPGWLHALRITVAQSELHTAYVERVRQRSTIEIPVDSVSEAISVDLFLKGADASPIIVEHALHVVEIERAGGGSAVLIARPTDLDAPVNVAFAEQIAEIKAGLADYGWDGPQPARVVIFGGDADGYLREVEVAIAPA